METIYPTPELKEHLRTIRHVALDMDGTIYNGKTLFPFTLPFFQRMKQLGISYSFLTNNPSRSIADYLDHLARMGVTASAEEMYTSAQATIDYLHLHYPEVKNLFILGTPSMISEFKNAGFVSLSEDAEQEPEAVVVGFDKSLVYPRLCRAAWWISQGKPYIATNPDRVCPTDEDLVLVDCGSICALLEYATGRKPDIVLGKPDPNMLTGIVEQKGLKQDEIAMVGDRVYTDIAMAHRAGVLGILVLSGETSLETGLQAKPRPELITTNLAELADLLEWATGTRELEIPPVSKVYDLLPSEK